VYEGVDMIQLTYDRDQRWAFVKIVMSVGVPLTREFFDEMRNDQLFKQDPI